MHKIMFAFRDVIIDEGAYLLKEGVDTDSVYIVMYGELECFLIMEGNKFVFEKLK